MVPGLYELPAWQMAADVSERHNAWCKGFVEADTRRKLYLPTRIYGVDPEDHYEFTSIWK
jgi:hypothetical protein